MEKTIVELFAGVGGCRCGLNNIRTCEDAKKPEKWKTVGFSQWEPIDKKTQWAWSCYTNHFGTVTNIDGDDVSNIDIAQVDKSKIPDHSLVTFTFPCQDYSVSQSLKTSKGIEGKKGVLWWSVNELLEVKGTPFALGENVDRLIKSPAKQKGRDFA